jgi:hypothetical protein
MQARGSEGVHQPAAPGVLGNPVDTGTAAPAKDAAVRESRIVDLPDDVTFTLVEVVLLRFVADAAVERTPEGSSEHTRARRAQRLITSPL